MHMKCVCAVEDGFVGTSTLEGWFFIDPNWHHERNAKNLWQMIFRPIAKQ